MIPACPAALVLGCCRWGCNYLAASLSTACSAGGLAGHRCRERARGALPAPLILRAASTYPPFFTLPSPLKVGPRPGGAVLLGPAGGPSHDPQVSESPAPALVCSAGAWGALALCGVDPAASLTGWAGPQPPCPVRLQTDCGTPSARCQPGLRTLSHARSPIYGHLCRYELGSEDDSLEMARRKLTTLKPRFHVMLVRPAGPAGLAGRAQHGSRCAALAGPRRWRCRRGQRALRAPAASAIMHVPVPVKRQQDVPQHGPLIPCLRSALQTTYDVVIRDTAVLRGFDWSAVVIDEGHSLKGGRPLCLH